MPDCSTGSVIRGEIEEVNHSPLSPVTTQGACRRRRTMVRRIILKMSRGERKIEGDVQGDCRRWEKIAESILVFLGG
jgi:hypothetical protein